MVLLIDSKTPFAHEIFDGIGEVRVVPTPAISRKNLHDVDAVIIRSETRVGPDLLDGTPVRFVGTATIGVDHVDAEYLEARQIGFASAPGSNANSVAEYVATALLVLAGRTGMQLKGKVLGVVGVGNVGSRVVRVGEALGMNVLKNDPPLARMHKSTEYISLDALMQADFLTLHVPLTRGGPDATYHLFDEARIGRMKQGSVLINTSRGGVVDTLPLRDALRRDQLREAVLDVWEREPDIDIELLRSTALGTAHIAGYSFDGKVNAARMIFDAICSHFSLQTRWPGNLLLPATEHETITMPDDDLPVEEILRTILTTCYDIERDDGDLRALIDTPHEERGKMFRGLRAGYRVRREFGATTVYVPDQRHDLAASLRKLGFTVKSC